ncbi:hypothetical protein FA95DRAFT_1613254, partial [Auriscalpium vulgare]
MPTVSANPPRSFTLGRIANRDAQTAAWHKVGAARPTRVMSNEADENTWLASSNADWIPPFPDLFPAFVTERSDGLRGHHEPTRVPQRYNDARPWLAYMWSRKFDDPASLSLVRDKKCYTERWVPEPRRVAIRADTAQLLIDEYVAARELAEEVDIRLLDNQHRIPADLRLDDEVFTALRYGRTDLHSTLITCATVQRAIIELRGFALWANYTLAFKAGFITRQEDLLPVVGCWVLAKDTHIWETLTYGGVPCWRATPTPPKDPAAYFVPITGVPADLALDDWDEDVHHPRPEHTYGRKEQKARAEIARLEAAGKHWDAMETQDAFDGYSQPISWDERVQARREMQGDSPSPEPRPPAPRRDRPRRRGAHRRSRSHSPRRGYAPYRQDGRLSERTHANRFARSRSPRRRRAPSRSQSPIAGPSHDARRGDRWAGSRSLSPPLLARRMAYTWRSPSPGDPDREPRLLRRLRSASPPSRSRSPSPAPARTRSRSRSRSTFSRETVATPRAARSRSPSPAASGVHSPLVSSPTNPMAVSPPSVPTTPALAAEPAAVDFGDVGDAPATQVLQLSATQVVRTSLAMTTDGARHYVRLGWWDDAFLASPLAPWESLSLAPPYASDQYQYPVPPPSVLESDRALYVWQSISSVYITTICNEPPARWTGGRVKEWKSRLRPKGVAGAALRNLPSAAPTVADLIGVTDAAGQPWVVLDEAARSGIRWAARTFLFRRDFERLVFARTPGAPLWPSNHALFLSVRARARRVWGSTSAFYPDVDEERFLDSGDELIRLRHWRAFGALLASREGVNGITIEAAMGGPVTDMPGILLRLFASYFRDTFDRDPT